MIVYDGRKSKCTTTQRRSQCRRPRLIFDGHHRVTLQYRHCLETLVYREFENQGVWNQILKS
jgi:hypothetical protein